MTASLLLITVVPSQIQSLQNLFFSSRLRKCFIIVGDVANLETSEEEKDGSVLQQFFCCVYMYIWVFEYTRGV